jgi:hypothetical protein
MKERIALVALISVFFVTNIVTVMYYENRITDLRSQSSFVEFASSTNIPGGSETLEKCLLNAMVDYKIDRSNVLVREVDVKLASAKCS